MIPRPFRGTAIALVTALVVGRGGKQEKTGGKKHLRLLIGCALGALTYVVLYMLKTFVFGLAVNGLTLEATYATMGAKLPASLINAVFAAVVAPAFYLALAPALKHMNVLQKM